jgi:hypothetical protein
MNRREVMELIGLGAIWGFVRPEKWVPVPLPAPEIEAVGDYTRVVVPMAFYSHVRRVTLVDNLTRVTEGPIDFEGNAERMARQIANDIEFEVFKA